MKTEAPTPTTTISSRPRTTATAATTTRTTTTERRRFAFGVGANLGDRAATIARALREIENELGELEVAPLYRSEPVADEPQPNYLNTVALGATERCPEELLGIAAGIERRLGRRRGRPNAAREIDLDLLFVGDLERRGPELELPHPRMRARRFVLAPLADLAPDLPLPPDGRTPRELLARLPERPWAVRLDPEDGP